jgi:uncharacterized GH25 family protein
MKVFLTLLAGLLCAPAGAHDFWVQPERFWSTAGAAIPITLRVGHGAERQRSAIRASRIVRFEAVGPDGARRDVRSDLRPGATSNDGQLRFEKPGTYVLALETDTRAHTTLPAARFNEYVEHEGLTPALEHREHAHQTGAPASERYRRVAKAIVQVSRGDDSKLPVTTPLGLPLEIVLELNPYAKPRAERLPIRVVFEDRPLPGALVKLTHLEHDHAPIESHRTDRAGRATFRMPQTGTWLLNVIWTKPLPPGAEVDFETTFSSLSFGFPNP